MRHKWDRQTVWLKGYRKSCLSALKISSLQEGVSRRTQTLETLRKYIAKPDHIKLENYYIVKKKRYMIKLKIFVTHMKDKGILFLIYKTDRSTAQ